MTAQITTVDIPPFAITIWCDLRSIYVTLPSHNGPCVVTFPRDSRGLSEVLRLMASRHEAESGTPYLAPPPVAKPTVNLTELQRATARSLLRRKGVLGSPR
jgi:hypothetical protein